MNAQGCARILKLSSTFSRKELSKEIEAKKMESPFDELQRIAVESKELISGIVNSYQDSVKQNAELIANEMLKDERERMEDQIQQRNAVFAHHFNNTKRSALELINSIREQARSKVQLLIQRKNQEMAKILQRKEEEYQSEMECARQKRRQKKTQNFCEDDREHDFVSGNLKESLSNKSELVLSQDTPNTSNAENKERINSVLLDSLCNSEIPVCHSCRSSDSGLLLCGGCEHVWYCNRACQEIDWDLHQASCSSETVAMETEQQ